MASTHTIYLSYVSTDQEDMSLPGLISNVNRAALNFRSSSKQITHFLGLPASRGNLHSSTVTSFCLQSQQHCGISDHSAMITPPSLTIARQDSLLLKNHGNTLSDLHTNIYIWNLEKWFRWTYLQSRNRDKKCPVYSAGGRRGVAWIGSRELRFHIPQGN